ncbi:hypothetical protein RRG08_034587 [Elysia crispata]|uniref:Uncharacterized protein n=1 Tax=Elysia crispata TaxID=231223 RepID=A0AAE1B325_9GAST|nr:hypothetical protein RRG08_034587 [Elysia crispata]
MFSADTSSKNAKEYVFRFYVEQYGIVTGTHNRTTTRSQPSHARHRLLTSREIQHHKELQKWHAGDVSYLIISLNKALKAPEFPPNQVSPSLRGSGSNWGRL